MFGKVDLAKQVDAKTFEKEITHLRIRLGELQREYRDRHIPVIIVIEGWNASGITMVTGALIQHLDPRGFTLHSIGSPSDEDRDHHLIWRFFIRTPQKGRIAIFARSWYSRFLAEKISGIDWKKEVKRSISTIRTFERQLSDDGAVILKFFLHISEQEQKRRLDEREMSLLTSWMITRGDWDFHSHYNSYLPIIDDFLEGTDEPYAPWTVIGATDPDYTVLKVFSTVVKTLEKHLNRIRDSESVADRKNVTEITRPKKTEVKRSAYGNITYTDSEYQELLTEYQGKIRDLQYRLFKRRIPLIILFEGWDAAGKGGNIMRLVRLMNPRGYDVVPIGKPDQTELDHHYLWRFYLHFPRAGHITIFDRSWYGRVLVERIEGVCSEYEWKRAYAEIKEMESSFIENGGGLIKFWLEIDRDEQLKRFTARQQDPYKQWKITEEDWRNREKWAQYEGAVSEMLARTSSSVAPWTVIESNEKKYARLKTLSTVIDYTGKLFR